MRLSKHLICWRARPNAKCHDGCPLAVTGWRSRRTNTLAAGPGQGTGLVVVGCATRRICSQLEPNKWRPAERTTTTTTGRCAHLTRAPGQMFLLIQWTGIGPRRPAPRPRPAQAPGGCLDKRRRRWPRFRAPGAGQPVDSRHWQPAAGVVLGRPPAANGIIGANRISAGARSQRPWRAGSLSWAGEPGAQTRT